MTDFVTSLIARSYNEQPALKPRVASLFEPAANVDFTHAEGPGTRSVETPFIGEMDVESEVMPNVSRPVKIVRGERSAAQADYAPAAESVTPLSFRATQARLALESTEKRVPEPAVASVRPRKSPSRAKEEHDSEPAIDVRTAITEPGPKFLPPRMAALPNLRERSFQHEQRGELVIAPQAVPEIAVPLKRTGSQRDTDLEDRAQRRAASASPAVTASAERTVNVTIGRIEVRATTESTRPQRSRPASPVISLEDYLLRRSQGGSR
jgi:hypothetical protein